MTNWSLQRSGSTASRRHDLHSPTPICRRSCKKCRSRLKAMPAATGSTSTRRSSSTSTRTILTPSRPRAASRSAIPHWRWGMDYERLAKGYHHGLQKIYEMVINNDPCYAYLMKSNDVVDQKLVMAHVYGHCDFFKNNYWFSEDQPQDDGRDGEPRQPGPSLHGRSRCRGGRGVHRRLPEHRGPDRHPFAVHPPPRGSQPLRLRRRGASPPGRRRAQSPAAVPVEGLHGPLHQSAHEAGRRSPRIRMPPAARRSRSPSGPSGM